MTKPPDRPDCPRCGTALPPDAPAGTCPRCLLGAGLGSITGDDRADMNDQVDAPLTREEIADRFPRLEILELLGAGGMGVVYKARQTDLDRLVALKLLRPKVSGDPAFAERFGREARALARLSHPNIVGVHDFGEVHRSGDQGGLYYFVMEYVEGCNLREAIAAGAVQPAEALRIVPLICDALQFAHDQGVVHRDIKPENVLIGTDGSVKIADFGLAKLARVDSEAEGVGKGRARGREYTLTQRGQVMGTPHYMAPEQIEQPQDVDHRADIYSLGVVFYELLTGELPLGRFDPPSSRVQVDVRLDEVVLRTLEKQRDRRYQHASEVRTSLDTIAHSPAAAATGATVAPSPPVRAVEGVRDLPREHTGPRRLCPHAVVGLLMVLTSFGLMASMATFMSYRIAAPVGLAAMMTLVGGLVVSIWGWTRIYHSRGALWGYAFAIVGTFLPALGCVGAPALWLGARAPATATAIRTVPLPVAAYPAVAAEAGATNTTMPPMASGAPAHWASDRTAIQTALVMERVGAALESLDDAESGTGFDHLGPQVRDELLALDPDALLAERKELRAGLPLLLREHFLASPSAYRLSSIRFNEKHEHLASVTLQLIRDGGVLHELIARMERVGDKWYCARELVIDRRYE